MNLEGKDVVFQKEYRFIKSDIFNIKYKRAILFNEFVIIIVVIFLFESG